LRTDTQPAGQATILIVDDRPTNRQFLTTLLSYGGHRLLEAGDGAEALKLVRKEHPDLVISDILMPTMDGFEFAKSVRADPAIAATKIVFYTATYRATEAALLAKACGVKTVIAKPAEPQRVLDVVSEELGIAPVRSIPRAGPRPTGGDGDAVELSHLGVRLTDYVNDLRAVKNQLDGLVDRGLELEQERERLRGISTKFAQNLTQLHSISAKLYSLIELGMDLAGERNPQRLVQTFTSAARRILGTRGTLALVLHTSEQRLQHVACDGMDLKSAPPFTAADLREGLIGKVLAGDEAIRLLAPQGGQISGLPPGHPGAASVLAIPIGALGRRHGVVLFTDKLGSSEGFSEDDERTGLALAAQLGVMYENFELYDTLQRRAAQLQLEIGERIKAEQAARDAQTRFEQIATSIRDVFFLIDVKCSEMLYVSPAYAEIFGRSCESLYAEPMSWSACIHPDDREHAHAKFVEGTKTGAFEFEYRILRPDGEVRWIHVRGYPVADEAGRVVRTAGVARDITEAKNAEQQLAQAQLYYRATFEQAAIGVTYAGLDGRFLQVNRKLCEMLGYAEDELLGRKFAEFTHADDLAMSGDMMRRLLGPDPKQFLPPVEKRYIRKDGSVLWVLVAVTAIRSADGRPERLLSMMQDITARKHAEARADGLQRVYKVLSGINTLIVRAPEPDELLRESCRIAVHHGGFSVAWAGMVDDEAGEVKPVAWEGADEGYVLSVPRKLAEDSGSFGVVGMALRDCAPIVSNDIATDPRIAAATRAEALGSQSIVSMPLVVAGKALGVLVLHAHEKGFFDDQEMRLLLELAGDISFALDHAAKARRLDYLAYYDALTGLANRALFNERLQQQIAQADGQRTALILIDVERFKAVNDAYGRQAGDELLKQVAARMVREAGGAERIARMGADQFAVMSAGFKSEEQLARFVAKRLAQVFGSPFKVGEQEVRLSAKVGIALSPGDGAGPDALYASAEAALKQAKGAGESYLFFAPEMTARVAGRLKLETQLRMALEKDEFVLHYQPKVDLDTRAIVGVEALLRWQSPERGLVSPAEFIPILEETGLILEVGAWALRRAAREHRSWVERGLNAPRIAVNVSAIQLRQRDFVASVERALAEGVSPCGLDIEITESLVMSDVKANIEKLKALKELGVSIAIDDFGTGYSSLGYLARLPVHTLKIDRSFIITMLSDPAATTLVSTMISLAHSLRLKVVAEGVDKEDQEKLLRLLRCDEMQGYLFSKPLAPEALVALLTPASAAAAAKALAA